jgi:CRISPR system Cascade subunit CasE
MNYFSRIQLDTAHSRAREALLMAGVGDAYREHQWLWRFFAANAGAARDFLFRRIEPQGGQPALVYTVSARAPQAPHPAWRVDTREYAPQLTVGQRWRFELRANPVRSIRSDGGARSARHDVVMHAKKQRMAANGVQRWSQMQAVTVDPTYELVHSAVSDWLLGVDGKDGVASRHGFAVLNDNLQVDAYLQHRFPRPGVKPIRLSTVDLSGVLQVQDAQRFRQALLAGVGHGKAFGCGLLLVRRAD